MSDFKLFSPNTPANNFWANLGLPNGTMELHQTLHHGISFEVYDKIASELGLEKKELAKITAIAPATLSRRAKSGLFNKDESDRLYRVAQVYKACLDLFEGDNASAQLWLKQPVKALANQIPLSLLTTHVETEWVLDVIGRLEHGVYS